MLQFVTDQPLQTGNPNGARTIHFWTHLIFKLDRIGIPKLEKRAARVRLERHPPKIQKVKKWKVKKSSTFRLFELKNLPFSPFDFFHFLNCHKDTFSVFETFCFSTFRSLTFRNWFCMILHTFRLEPCSTSFLPSPPHIVGWCGMDDSQFQVVFFHIFGAGKARPKRETFSFWLQTILFQSQFIWVARECMHP